MPSEAIPTREITTMANDEVVVAVVSPRSVGGVSLFETPAPITAENVSTFHSEASVIATASSELRKLGFRVLQESPITFSIAGSPKLFESVFGVSLRKEKKQVMEGQEIEFFVAPGAPTEQLLRPPEALTNLIEGVALAEPPLLFESPLPPIVLPHPDSYRYLFVPDDVGLVLNAPRVHEFGTTGAGVRVAMPDTGFYAFSPASVGVLGIPGAHPFYFYHGYTTNRAVLGPGAIDAIRDDNGHGTGEAANIFAVAPGIELSPVKMASDTTGAFNAAVAQNPRVITNSWGYDIDRSGASLSPFLRTLEAAVAGAVASGIVVCFAAGNGHFAFPGSHPDVISCGGVMVNYPNLDLEASNYASSFDSSLYPGRHVPDLCGLVGRTVINRAPLIMLPVQPDCFLDITFSTGAPADGTSPGDGWALFSGTSAASPQIAGVVALMLQQNPALTPTQVKDILKRTATDVTVGNSSPSTGGGAAGPGPDFATGAGLVNAKLAWTNVLSAVMTRFFEAPPERQAEMLATGQIPRITRETREFVDRVLRRILEK